MRTPDLECGINTSDLERCINTPDPECGVDTPDLECGINIPDQECDINMPDQECSIKISELDYIFILWLQEKQNKNMFVFSPDFAMPALVGLLLTQRAQPRGPKD